VMKQSLSKAGEVSGPHAGAGVVRSGPAEHFDLEDSAAILAELEDICSDPAFQSSQRNCEFLRFVVSESLYGRGAELRERTLGVELFGRSGTYDTSSDAIVRVRATDVRKRLIRHYEQFSPATGWQISLPPRSYRVIFSRHTPKHPNAGDARRVEFSDPPEKLVSQDPRFLTWRQLLTPALFAFVLCAATFRWQVLADDPFMAFWSTLLVGRSSVDFVLDPSSDGPESVRIGQLRSLGPLLSITDRFKINAHFFVNSEKASVHDPNALVVHLTQQATGSGIRFEPGPPSTLWFQGQNQAEVDREIKNLTDTDTFPIKAREEIQQSAGFFIALDVDRRLSAAENVPLSSRDLR
jgi:hypothetical protein